MKTLRSSAHAVHLAVKAAWFALSPLFGARSRFEIAAGYRHRKHPIYFDANAVSDVWQREVYELARSLMIEHNLRTVYDVGCGDGKKLVDYLGQFQTLGIDLPETIAKVRAKYPERSWFAGSFDGVCLPKVDMVICADVIEHVEQPDLLLGVLSQLTDHWVVISTPARELLYAERELPRFGPPDNPFHIREWTMSEFHRFASRSFSIERHDLCNRIQGTQVLVGKPIRRS